MLLTVAVAPPGPVSTVAVTVGDPEKRPEGKVTVAELVTEANPVATPYGQLLDEILPLKDRVVVLTVEADTVPEDALIFPEAEIVAALKVPVNVGDAVFALAANVVVSPLILDCEIDAVADISPSTIVPS